MAGKISEYIQIAVKKASDLLDMTVDVGGGLLETRSITALNFFKPRTKSVAFAQPQIVINFGFETTATVNITGDTTIFIGTYDNGGVYQLILYPDATPRTVTLGSSFGSNLESSNMQFVTYPNRPYVIKIYVSNSGQVSNSIEKWQSAPTDILAGGNEVVFKTQFGYFTRTLTAISAWIKSALYTSEVLNDSNLLGADLNDVLNVADAIEKPLIQDGDALALARMNGGVSENIFVLAENAKDYFGGAGNGNERYSETAVVDATGGYGPFNFASIPNEFEIENIEIYADVDNTPSIFINFENQTDVFSGIIGSTTLIFGKTLLIEGATTIGCFAPYTPTSKQFTYRVRNVYGSARRLQLAFGSMGNPAHYTIKTTFRRIP